MKTVSILKSLVATFTVLACALVFTGCSADGEVDNVSERPWNDTQGWQGGLPSGLNEGR